MSLWTTLKASIDAVITTKNATEISGADVRGRLNAMASRRFRIRAGLIEFD